MNFKNILDDNTKILSDNDIPTARLDVLVLIEDITGKDRGWLLAHPDFKLTIEQTKLLDSAITRRAQHEPLAYIRGTSEFYGRVFKISPDTLQPRPETETMIDLFKELVESRKLKVESYKTNVESRKKLVESQKSKVRSQKSKFESQKSEDESLMRIVDVGTGSGAIAITAKLEWPDFDVHATDINQAALTIAQQNATALKADIHFYKGNLLTPLLSTTPHLPSTIYHLPTTILANLPYVPNDHMVNKSALHEPSIALFGGDDGLDLYREMFDQLKGIKDTVRFVLTESLPLQHKELASIAQTAGFKLMKTVDLIQIFENYC